MKLSKQNPLLVASILLAFLTGVSAMWPFPKSASPKPVVAPPSPSPSTVASDHQNVCVVGAGVIGSSFCTVFLARGMSVVCLDPFTSRDTLEQRIAALWPHMVARGVTRLPKPPLDRLAFTASMEEAVRGATFVQECTWEDADNKQKVLADLDRLVDPSVLIASSTSFIPWSLLSQACQNNPDRIVIGHPAIPHSHSFMEIYGPHPGWTAYCQEWYSQAGGFDVLVMHKTVPGHVLNSFVAVNMEKGQELIRQGVCSPDDVNRALRHLGRDLYARHTFVELLTKIGGDRGVEGGVELSKRIRNDAIFLVLFSAMKGKGVPGWIAKPVSRWLSGLLKSLLPDGPEEFLEAAAKFGEDVTDGGRIPVQEALFKFDKEIYEKLPMEVGNDLFLSVKRSSSGK